MFQFFFSCHLDVIISGLRDILNFLNTLMNNYVHTVLCVDDFKIFHKHDILARSQWFKIADDSDKTHQAIGVLNLISLPEKGAHGLHNRARWPAEDPSTSKSRTLHGFSPLFLGWPMFLRKYYLQMFLKSTVPKFWNNRTQKRLCFYTLHKMRKIKK
jgi:hypothetical protein